MKKLILKNLKSQSEKSQIVELSSKDAKNYCKKENINSAVNEFIKENNLQLDINLFSIELVDEHLLTLNDLNILNLKLCFNKIKSTRYLLNSTNYSLDLSYNAKLKDITNLYKLKELNINGCNLLKKINVYECDKVTIEYCEKLNDIGILRKVNTVVIAGYKYGIHLLKNTKNLEINERNEKCAKRIYKSVKKLLKINNKVNIIKNEISSFLINKKLF